MTTLEMLLLVGVERQYRAWVAGLSANALVAVGSTLFVWLSVHGFAGESADPTRVAAQIVSGIGFLGGGVIQRDDKQMESAVGRLSLDPSVTSVRWQVDTPQRNESENDE